MFINNDAVESLLKVCWFGHKETVHVISHVYVSKSKTQPQILTYMSKILQLVLQYLQ